MTSTRGTSSDTISGGHLALVFNTDVLQVCNMYSSCYALALALALRFITHFVPPSPTAVPPSSPFVHGCCVAQVVPPQ